MRRSLAGVDLALANVVDRNRAGPVPDGAKLLIAHGLRPVGDVVVLYGLEIVLERGAIDLGELVRVEADLAAVDVLPVDVFEIHLASYTDVVEAGVAVDVDVAAATPLPQRPPQTPQSSQSTTAPNTAPVTNPAKYVAVGLK